MPNIIPIAYNTGASIPGTTQLGDLAIGDSSQDYGAYPSGVRFWASPDLDLYYIIAYPNPAGDSPNPLSIPAYVSFDGTSVLTDGAFLNLANYFAQGITTFTTTSDAITWLTANGYWTNYSPITPTPTNTATPTPTETFVTTPSNTPSNTPTSTPQATETPTPTNTSTPTNTPSNTTTNTPTQTPTSSTAVGQVVNMTLLEVGGNVILSGSGTMDITSLGSPTQTFGQARIVPTGSQFGCGLEGPGPFNCSIYSSGTITSPANFGTGGPTNGTGTGDFFGIGFSGDKRVFVPIGYVSGSFISGTTTFNSTTLATLGATPGTYTWSWGSGANASSIILQVGTPSVTPTNTPTETVTPTVTQTVTNTPSETPTNTPTPSVTQTVTNTPSETPTNTPTPSVTPEPVTGYSFNLVATPYNFPTSGNSIMNSAGGITTGSTEINLLATGARGFYFNAIDSNGIDRTSYFSGFTGQSVTITFTQTGNTAIYSGDTNSFKEWIQAPMGSGYVFGAGIGVPPVGAPSGTAVLIQSATTQYTIGLPVYVSLNINV